MKQPLSIDQCFVCGVTFDEKSKWHSRTNEDIIPSWLQRRFHLEAKGTGIVHGNGQKFRYAATLTGCCRECNNVRLSSIEGKVQKAFDSGADAVRSLPRNILVPWLVKIHYGMMHREHFLKHSVRDPFSPMINDSDTLEGIHDAWELIYQASTGTLTESDAQNFASVFVFDTLVNTNGHEFNFDYASAGRMGNVIGIRAGHVAVAMIIGHCGFYERQHRENKALSIPAHRNDVVNTKVIITHGIGVLESRFIHPMEFTQILGFLMYIDLTVASAVLDKEMYLPHIATQSYVQVIPRGGIVHANRMLWARNVCAEMFMGHNVDIHREWMKQAIAEENCVIF